MKIAIMLAIGESWEEFQKTGQDQLLIADKLKPFTRAFSQVVVFSYGKKSQQLLPGVQLVGHNKPIHRYLYSLLLPVLQRKKFKSVDLIRGLQLSGGIPAAVAKIFYGKKFVINYGYDYPALAQIERKYLRGLLYKLLENWLIQLADAVIVTTPALKKKISCLRDSGVYLIPNGVDTQLFKPRKTLFKKKLSPQLLFVGRLERQKNLFMLIDAVSQLKGYHPKVTFVGQGSLQNQLAAYANKKRVQLKLVKFQPHNQLPQVYSQADLFVLPSVREGHPKALLEAMACGLPVVGTRVAGIQPLIQHNRNGLLAQLSVDSLSNAIKIIFSHPGLAKKLATHARQTAVKYYNAAQLRQQEVKLLKQLALKK